MAGKKPWLITQQAHGRVHIALSHWKHFANLIHKHLKTFAPHSTAWRGQADADWPLESSLDRMLRRIGKLNDPDARRRHLEGFKLAVRGRRGMNPQALTTDDDWWALGQHYGLATPLVDWTRSPFVALYFAFAEDECKSGKRAVWAIQRLHADDVVKGIFGSSPPGTTVRPIRFFEPLTDENSRLVSQNGLLSRGPDGLTLDQWAKDSVAASTQGGLLLKLEVPDKDRTDCLTNLNRMNINHLTLFPDLYGASSYCNIAATIDKY